ncbi:MAG: DUF924 domain-containing protein [Alphaproteobacteria bacterium]|nr:DUF924 domain-containing protein [Alphaproteobacteria bacterium]
MPVDDWVRDVLSFWFDELAPSDWFGKRNGVDEKIRRRFLPLYDRLAEHASKQQPVSAKHALATIIVLDQFPRNLFRESPKAFATDEAALALAKAAITSGLDTELSVQERQFLYMPYQHAESSSAQVRSIELYTSLGVPSILSFAVRHKEIIDRFGRFPHRNEILGRASTQEELEFLNRPDSSF